MAFERTVSQFCRSVKPMKPAATLRGRMAAVLIGTLEGLQAHYRHQREKPMKTERNIIQIWLLGAAMLQAVTSDAQPVTKIAAGFGHSLFLKSDGSLWAMGDNYAGALGDGTYNNTNRPEQIVVSGVTTIAAGCGGLDGHSLFLKSDGSLWAMGDNFYGQLGAGPFGHTNRPQQIVTSGVIAIAAGYEHSLFLKSDGSLWGMGDNSNGQLGGGAYVYTNRPQQIVAGGVAAIAAGGSYSLFLQSGGSLWAMGYNLYGQLGDGTTNNINRPEQIVASGVTAIAAGGGHSLFLTDDGSLWAMGHNLYGQLGDGTTNNINRPEQIVGSGVTAIAAGDAHNLFLKDDGSLWAVGCNTSGQLGDGTYNNTNRPEQIVASGVTAIAAGRDFSLFLKSDGSLWAVGWNGYGELGDGTCNQTVWPKQTLAGPEPVLGITMVSSLPVVVWPGWGTGYVLQMTTNLNSSNWVAVTNGIPFIGLQITNVSGTTFFRLH